MSNELTTIGGQLTIPAAESQVSLLEIRRSPEKFPRIGSVSREVAVIEMMKIVSQAYLYRGQSADKTNIQFISCSLVDELQGDLDRIGTKFISFAEISRIVKRAVLTQDMFGISVASLYRVIVDYIKGEGHRLQKEAEKTPKRNPAFDAMVQAYAGAMTKSNTKIK